MENATNIFFNYVRIGEVYETTEIKMRVLCGKQFE